MTNIWEADIKCPTEGMVVRLDDGRVYRIVEVMEHGYWNPLPPKQWVSVTWPETGIPMRTIWAVVPRPKKGGWSKSRKGWSDRCWEEMMQAYNAEIVQ